MIGVLSNGHAKAYDCDALTYTRFIESSFDGVPVLLTLENDNASFHVWNGSVKGHISRFERVGSTGEVMDTNIQSKWNMQGTW